MKRNAFLLLLALATLALLPGCARVLAATPGEDGVIEIVMDDYSFSPNTIRLQAGQTVTIRLRNEGDKMHEFMAGRDIQLHGNFTEGFGQDFFAGIDLEISGPGMVMGLEGMEMDMGGMDMSNGQEMDMAEEDHEEGAMDMENGHDEEVMEMSDDEHDDEMDMGDDEHEEGAMDMEDDHDEETMDLGDEEHDDEMDLAGEDHDDPADDHDEGEDDHQEGADDHDDEEEEEGIVAGRFGPVQLPSMDAHAGVMIMIDPQLVEPGQATTITFTVPESKIGTWEIGCFQERGQHYDDGMNGLIIVER